MDIKNLINSHFKIIDIYRELDDEKCYLVNQLKDPDNLYYLSVYKINDLSESKVEEIITNLQAISQLKNTNNILFPRIIDVFKENDYLFFVYEYLKGDTLAKNLENNHLWDENTTLQQMRNLLETLAYLHSHNLIHQSIKPESITINNNQQELLFNNYGKIIDSPSSNLMATITIQDRLYLAPEVITGRTTFASDIYALGILVINMLLGKKIIELNDDDEGNLIWEKEVNIEQNLINIIKKMTNTNINKRYQNINQIIEDLDAQFPRENQSQTNKNGYTPTEILPVDDTDSTPQAEEKETLNTTEFVEPSPEEEKSNENKIKSLPETQISMPLTDDLNTQDKSKEKAYFSVKSPQANQNNDDNNSLINNDTFINKSEKSNTEKQKNNSNKQVKIPTKAQIPLGMVRRLKSPQALIISFAIGLILIFGAGVLKSYLNQKYVTQISQELKTYYETDQFQKCLDLINSDKVKSLAIIDTIEQQFLGKCWLGLAELEAIKGNYSEAIRKAVNVNNKSADYQSSKEKIEEWAEEIFLEAKTVCTVQKNIPLAKEIANDIPQSSKWRKKSLDLWATCGKENVSPSTTYDLCQESPLLCPD